MVKATPREAPGMAGKAFYCGASAGTGRSHRARDPDIGGRTLGCNANQRLKSAHVYAPHEWGYHPHQPPPHGLCQYVERLSYVARLVVVQAAGADWQAGTINREGGTAGGNFG